MTYALVAEHIVKEYGSLKALDDVSLHVKKGTFFGLLGPNGAGKTTLMSIFSTLKKPTDGTVNVFGVDAIQYPLQVRQVQGVVFQDPSHDDELTAYEILRMHAKLYGVSKERAEKKIREVLELVGLYDRKDDFARTFSGGMRRRMEIARALVHDPDVLYLDEPTTGLDPQTRNHLWEYLAKLKGKTTILLTTHYMEEAEKLCDEIAIIDHGKIIAEGTASELKKLVGGEILRVSSKKDIGQELREYTWKKVGGVDGFFEVRADNASEELPKLLRHLHRAGINIDTVDIHKVTLEDVFLHLTGRTMREENATETEGKLFHTMGRQSS